MKRNALILGAAIIVAQAIAASKDPRDIAGSRIGISKAEVQTNAASAPVGYGNVRQGLDSLTYLVASSRVVLNEQGLEYGEDPPSSDDSMTKKDTGKKDTEKNTTQTDKTAGEARADMPSGTLSKSVYKTFYFDKYDRVVAIQMSFENISRSDLAELLRVLDEKYIKDIQKQTDVYTFSLSNFVKLECSIQGTAFRDVGNERKQPIRFRVINLYYNQSRLQKTLRDSNERNAIKFKELI